jgi:hypothetical protein
VVEPCCEMAIGCYPGTTPASLMLARLYRFDSFGSSEPSESPTRKLHRVGPNCGPTLGN